MADTKPPDVLVFLDALDRLHGRITAASESGDIDFRLFMDLVDLVEIEHERVRGMAEQPWPDTLWHDYRISLVLVQRRLMMLFDDYPQPPPARVLGRAVEVVGWLAALERDIRPVVGRPQLH